VRGEVIAHIRRGGAVCNEAALEAPVVGLSHRCVHAHIGRDAAEEQTRHAARAKEVLEVGCAEGALAWFVDDVFARQWLQLVDQLPSRLTTHEHAAHWPRLANLGADGRRAQPLVLRQIGKARSVALARMDHSHIGAARRLEHSLQRLDRRASGVDIVPHAVNVATVAAEVNLHVDDDEGSCLWVELATARPGVGDRLHYW